MTQKHYIQFALALREVKTVAERKVLMDFLCPLFKADNVKLKEELFRNHAIPPASWDIAAR